MSIHKLIKQKMTEQLPKQLNQEEQSDPTQEQGVDIMPDDIEVRFDAKSGTILLGLGGKEKVNPALIDDLESQGFSPKEELHMTVIGFKQGKEIKQLLKQNPDLLEQIQKLIAETEWGIAPSGERYAMSKQYDNEEQPRESIIEMVTCEGGRDFIAKLNALTGLNLEEQPPHVTLATKGSPSGIGVNTAQDIIELGRKIS